jgi:GT2 family glycosyltransferase
VSRARKIVVLGMMSKMPVAGAVWQTVHYLLGLERLGYETYYVEAHARTPSMFMRREDDHSSALAAGFINRVLSRFGLGDRWAFHALHDDERCYGLGERELRGLYRSAELLINLHGGTVPRDEHRETGRLVYLETDPVELEIELQKAVPEAIDFVAPHFAFFTWGLNYRSADCRVPLPHDLRFHPSPPPVLLDLWQTDGPGGGTFTTVGNWRQAWRDVVFDGEVYTWSKHVEFLKILGLPLRVSQPFELALASYEEADRQMLEEHGWRVRPALAFSSDLDAYRDYVRRSRGELTVAKDQNVRLRSGWFSERSASYLAAGRPVITQDTGFGSMVPTGEGLFAFSTIEHVLEAVEAINTDYRRHSHAATDIAREYFDAEIVLTRLLDEVGVERARGVSLVPVSRRPTTLPGETIREVLSWPLPRPRRISPSTELEASVVVVTLDNLPFTRLCLESVLAHTDEASEIVVVDNGSSDGTVEYLHELARGDARLRPICNGANLGFARANNMGLDVANGDLLVLLNNDTVVAPDWLSRLATYLDEPSVGAVGPVTNRIGNEAQVDVEYGTYGEYLDAARARAVRFDRRAFEIRTLAMFCFAFRRDIYERIGGLDERFEVGLLEDDDYSMRLHAHGLRLLCADDVLVHHFGAASFGKLVPSGEYDRVLAANRRRFEEKWGVAWEPYGRRHGAPYLELATRIRDLVHRDLPPAARILVVSRGDDELLRLNGSHASHFPQAGDGVYAGHYPADSAEAIAQLEALRQEEGFEFLILPRPAFWWLEFYDGFREHLDRRCRLWVENDDCLIFALSEPEERRHAAGAGATDERG